MPVSARHGWLTRFACAMVLPAWCLAVPGVVDYKFGAECQWLRELTKQDCIG
eukprot:COSAG01_NODE_30206_length_620_cov_5.316699_2_plen_51_part_01